MTFQGLKSYLGDENIHKQFYCVLGICLHEIMQNLFSRSVMVSPSRTMSFKQRKGSSLTFFSFLTNSNSSTEGYLHVQQ